MKFTLYAAMWDDHHPLDTFFPDAPTKCVMHPDELDAPGILIIHGGEDVSPAMYGRSLSPRTHALSRPSRRDVIESTLIKAAMEKGIKVFGICRGAQLMCAVAGGYLIQDVTNHAGARHPVFTNDGKIIPVNSLHHQMQAPWGIPHELVAWSEVRSGHYDDAGQMVKVPNEPEAVFYPGMGLGVQWHPEMLSAEHESNVWLKDAVNKYLT